MIKTAVRLSIAILLAAGIACSAFGQAKPYPSADVQKIYDRLLKEIDKIPMYDNHAHPGYADDTDVDAMASPPDESATLRLRDDNPEFVAGAKALFGYPYDDFKPEHSQMACGEEIHGGKGRGHRLFQQYSRQVERGHLPGQPRDDAHLSRYQALPLGLFRRRVFLPLR